MNAKSVPRPLQLVVLTVLLTSTHGLVVAQSVVVDEGSFTISVNGRRAGTEDFAIRRSGVGPDAQIIATAEITITGREGRLDLRPALQVVGGVMAVAAYQMKISGSRDEEVFVTAGEGRFLLRMRSDRGERERELRAAPGTLLLDTDVAHQHYFLTHRLLALGRSLPVILPREGRQDDLTITDSGPDSVRIAGQDVESRHIRLSIGQDIRDVWIDPDGRVLRVADTSSGYTAVRTALP